MMLFMKKIILLFTIPFILFGCKKSDSLINASYAGASSSIGLQFEQPYKMTIYCDAGPYSDTIIFHSNNTITENGIPCLAKRDTSFTYPVEITVTTNYTAFNVSNNTSIEIGIKDYSPVSTLMQYMGKTGQANVAFYESGPIYDKNQANFLGIELPDYINSACYAILVKI